MLRILSILLICSLPAMAATWYVDVDATGANDGTSWSDAWTNASEISLAGIGAGNVVRFAEGTYDTLPDLNKSGTSGNQITFTVATNPSYAGHVYWTNSVNLWADYISIIGTTNEDYAVPDSVNDIDLITNNIFLHITSATGRGLTYANGSRTSSHVRWVHFYECGKFENMRFPANSEPAQDTLHIGDETYNCEIAYCWFQDTVFGDAINSPKDHSNLRIHDNLFSNCGDDVMQIPGGMPGSGFLHIYRNKITKRAWGYASGHTDAFQFWGNQSSTHHNLVIDLGEFWDTDRTDENTYTLASSGNYSYGPLSFQFNTGGATNELISAFTTNGNIVADSVAGAWRGFRFTANSNFTVTALGRVFFTGNDMGHTIRLAEVSSAADSSPTVRAEAHWQPSGGVNGQIHYTNCTPYECVSNTMYLLISGEEKAAPYASRTGDVYSGPSTPITANGAISVDGSVFAVSQYGSVGYIQTSDEFNHDVYFYNNAFINNGTNYASAPGLKMSHDAWRVDGKHAANNIISNFYIANNLILYPNGRSYDNEFYWVASDASRGTNDLFTVTNSGFINNTLLYGYSLTQAQRDGSSAGFPVVTDIGATPDGDDWGPITTDFYVSNSIIVGPNYQVMVGTNQYSTPVAAEAASGLISNLGTNVPNFVSFDKFDGYPSHVFRLNRSDTAAQGQGVNLTHMTNLLEDINRDLDWNIRPAATAWDIGPYQYSASGLILFYDFDDDEWTNTATGYMRDMSGKENHGYQYGYGGGTNWPSQTTGTNGTRAAAFSVTTNSVLTYNIEGDYIGITNNSDFTNLTAATFAVWCKHGASYSGSWEQENRQSFVNGGYGYKGAFSWGKNGSKPVVIHYQTNDVVQEGELDEVFRYPDPTGSDGASTNDLWHHYAFTYNGTNFSGYFDGAFVSNSVVDFGDATNLNIKGWVGIGCNTHYTTPNPQETPEFGDDIYPNHGWLNAELDDLRVYNTALTASEIQNIYLGGSASATAEAGEEEEPPVTGGGTTNVMNIGTLYIY